MRAADHRRENQKIPNAYVNVHAARNRREKIKKGTSTCVPCVHAKNPKVLGLRPQFLWCVCPKSYKKGAIYKEYMGEVVQIVWRVAGMVRL